jgi:S1-C subfamily serine protease
VKRPIPAPNGYTIPEAIRTRAQANRGNSGSPLVDPEGRVWGVIGSGSCGGENLAFAVSTALVEQVVPSLVEDGEYGHAHVGAGLATVTPRIAERGGPDRTRGVLVDEIVPGGVGRRPPPRGRRRRRPRRGSTDRGPSSSRRLSRSRPHRARPSG